MAVRIIDGYPAIRRLFIETLPNGCLAVTDGLAVYLDDDQGRVKALAAQMQEGDEVWLTESGVDEDELRGCEGMLLVRGDKLVTVL